MKTLKEREQGRLGGGGGRRVIKTLHITPLYLVPKPIIAVIRRCADSYL